MADQYRSIELTVNGVGRDHHGLQCGFCTPGFLITATALLQRNPDQTEEEIRIGLSGNLCRCTGYQHIVESVQAAARRADRVSPRGRQVEPAHHVLSELQESLSQSHVWRRT